MDIKNASHMCMNLKKNVFFSGPRGREGWVARPFCRFWMLWSPLPHYCTFSHPRYFFNPTFIPCWLTSPVCLCPPQHLPYTAAQSLDDEVDGCLHRGLRKPCCRKLKQPAHPRLTARDRRPPFLSRLSRSLSSNSKPNQSWWKSPQCLLMTDCA